MAQGKKVKQSFLESKVFNNLMGKLYGFGASIVIIGTLFKIQHYPGANIMLPLGLGMEAIIFFFSAFQKAHIEPDWSLVYPQFLDKYHTRKEIQDLIDANAITKDYANSRYSGADSHGGKQAHADKSSTNKGSNDAVLDHLLEKANVSDATIKDFGKGLENFVQQSKKITDITSAAVASSEYADSMKKATKSVENMQSSFEHVAKNITSNMTHTDQYSKNLTQASEAAAKLALAYKETTNSIKSQADNYQNASRALYDNLNALNSVYELQLKETVKQKDTSTQINKGIDAFVKNIEASGEAAKTYQKEIATLSQKISALNQVYGNMLTAMNVNVSK